MAGPDTGPVLAARAMNNAAQVRLSQQEDRRTAGGPPPTDDRKGAVR